MSETPGFDLDATSRQALELDAVLAFVASFAATTTGRKSLLALAPTSGPDELIAQHAAVGEAREHLARFGSLISGRIPDPEPALGALDVLGLFVDPLPLRDLASALLEAAALRRRLSGIEGDGFPALKSLGRGIPDVGALAQEVVKHIAPDGTLDDGASPELRRIRQAIAKTGERLRRQLEAFLHDPAAASFIRDEFVTQRNGRFVIPVRADSPRPIEGIVHAASSSGQTLFVEPIESVALNNELVRLADQEAGEHDRVVRGWTERFRGRREEVAEAIAGLGRADSLQARAVFASRIDGCLPSLAPDAPLRLVAAVHPLLDRRLREQGSRCVPVSFAIEPSARVLVISGPNTGGKTVALKTVGLACVMAQCGLPVAASSASLPVFRQLRADIGDHQSIDADLSTFSAHVGAVARYLDEADPPALFLFDEIGTGTEPGEGAALGRAVLERLLRLGVTAIATTHHAALKGWAFSDARVASAAMEFDESTLRPTYRVVAGAAGSSAGIDIAARLGLDAALVARARELCGREGLEAENLMTRLRESTAKAEDRLADLEREREALAIARSRLEEKTKDESARLQVEARSALVQALEEFGERSKRELLTIHDAKERAAAARAQEQATRRLRTLARERQEAIAPSRKADAGPFVPMPGARVVIVSLEREGEIVAVRGERIDVRMGSATFTVSLGDVAAASGEAPLSAKPGKLSRLASLAAASRAAGSDEPDDALPQELHLLGQTVDEALPVLDRFLDASARQGRVEVRVVHGHGTGRLRIAVRAHLKGHPQVVSFRPGGPGEGGDGATVVTLV